MDYIEELQMFIERKRHFLIFNNNYITNIKSICKRKKPAKRDYLQL